MNRNGICSSIGKALGAVTAFTLGVQTLWAGTVKIASGETHAVPCYQSHAYTYYRFVVKDRNLEDPQQLTFTEIALYDEAGNRVNGGLSAVSYDEDLSALAAGTCTVGWMKGGNKPFDQYFGPENLFDGDTSTFWHGWAQPYNLPWAWIYYYMCPAVKSVVTSYRIAYTYYPNSPRSWALEGSDDLNTWVTLDETSAAKAAELKPGESEAWINGGNPLFLYTEAPETNDYVLMEGGTLKVEEDVRLGAVVGNGGVLSIAAGATAEISAPIDESVRIAGGGLAGSGELEKTGEGTLTIDGLNDGFSGSLKVTSGTLRFAAAHVVKTPCYRYYRLVVKNRNTSRQELMFSEIALYDLKGNRINGGLTKVSFDENLTNMTAGTCAVGWEKGGSQQFNPYFDVENLFDGDMDTFWYGWVQPYVDSWAWVYYYMRPASEAAVASYSLAFKADDIKPLSWSLQGSDDATTWATLDEKTTEEAAQLTPASYPGWIDGGTPLALVAEPEEGHHAPLGTVSSKLVRFSVREFGSVKPSKNLTPHAYTYYRFVVKDRNLEDPQQLTFTEIALYDEAGSRVNGGLSAVSYDEGLSALAAGTCTVGWMKGGNKPFDQYFGPENLFDGDTSTFWHGWAQPYNLPWAWIYYYMCPAVKSVVTSYSIAYTYYPNSPRSWALEGSDDLNTWVTLDETSAADAVKLKPGESEVWINGGKALQAYDTCEIAEFAVSDIWGNRLNAGLTASVKGYGKALPADEETWMRMTLRLPDTSASMASYNFMPIVSNAKSLYPASWQVEVSADDGVSWTIVDEREGDEAAGLIPAVDGYCNGGYPIGLRKGLDHTLAPSCLSSVQVVGGACLELPSGSPVSALVIDLSQNDQTAEIKNLNLAANGVLALVGSSVAKPQLDDMDLNVRLIDSVGVTNCQVSINGILQRDGVYALRIDEAGKLRMTKNQSGLMILVR